MSKNDTNVADFIGGCNAGILKQQIAAALSEAAMHQISHAKGSQKASITLTLTMAQLGANDQVMISHKLSTKYPTKDGDKIENSTTLTSFFVGKGGQLTINPPVEEESGQYQLDREIEGISRVSQLHN